MPPSGDLSSPGQRCTKHLEQISNRSGAICADWVIYGYFNKGGGHGSLFQRISSRCDSGKGTHEVALKFQVSESWVRRIKQERRETGKIAPATKRNRSTKWAQHADLIREAVAEKPDSTLDELLERLGIGISRSTLFRALKALRLTFKKSPECC